MRVLVVMRGLPASGKSTRARQIATDLRGAVVCRDDLRVMLHGADTMWAGITELEEEVTHAERALVRTFLRRGKPVVVDATNLNSKVMRSWETIAKDHGAHLEVVDIDTSAEECKRRDAARARPVGADVIDRIAKAHNR